MFNYLKIKRLPTLNITAYLFAYEKWHIGKI